MRVTSAAVVPVSGAVTRTERTSRRDRRRTWGTNEGLVRLFGRERRDVVDDRRPPCGATNRQVTARERRADVHGRQGHGQRLTHGR